MHHLSLSWHIISLKCSSWNIICFEQKGSINIQFFRPLTAMIKVYPIPHAIFETTRSGIIQILHHCSLSWKITLQYFFTWSIIWFGQKEPIKVQSFRISTAHVKFHQICTLIGSFYLCLMTLKSDVEFKEKLICCFKNDKNLVNFYLSTEKSQKFVLWLLPFMQSI